MKKLKDIGVALGTVVVFLAFWFILAETSGYLFPTPIAVAEKIIFIAMNPISKATLPLHVAISLARVLAAFLLAVLVGIGFGVALGWNRTVNNLAFPLFEILRPVPPIAWIPLIILWFGIGETPKVLVVFIGCVVPIALNTYLGMTTVDPMLAKAARALGANRRQMLFEVVFPAGIPAIFAGMRTALSTGWMCVLAGEMVVARQGVGFLIVRGMESGDSQLIVSGMVVIGLVSALLSLALGKIEEALCPWLKTTL